MFDDEYLAAIEQRIADETSKATAAGARVIGVYCAFTPKELISAAGAIPVSLCAGSQRPIALAEEHLPRNLCALIKSSYGHALGGTCPYFAATDMLIADATCDGKKKMYELLGRLRPLHLLQLPQTSETAAARVQWRLAVHQLKDVIERCCDCTITAEKLREQIHLYNRMRRIVAETFDLNRGAVPLLRGRELNNITSAGGFDVNLATRITEIGAAIQLAGQRRNDPEYLRSVSGKPRILLTGCPNTNGKVLHLIEECGGMVVVTENCGGMKTVGELVAEDVEDDALLDNLAERYLRIACSCMTPNHRRLELLRRLIADFRVDGVIELTWDGCHTYNIEAIQVQECITAEDIPYLHITTDYSEHDTGQLKTRIEAFLEMLA